MSQTDILKLLKKEKRGLTSNEIMEKLNIGRSSVCQNLCRLTKFGDVVRIEKTVGVRWQYVYMLPNG